MNKEFSDKAVEILDFSREEAERLRSHRLYPEHLLLGILRDHDNKAYDILLQFTIDTAKLKMNLDKTPVHLADEEIPNQIDIPKDDILLAEQTERIFKFSGIEALIMKSPEIEPEHLLLAILKENNNVPAKLLADSNLTYQTLHIMFAKKEGFSKGTDYNTSVKEDDVAGSQPQNGYDPMDDDDDGDSMFAGKNDAPKSSGAQQQQPAQGGETPAINRFGYDITDAAKNNRLDQVVGRSQEIERVIQVLSRRKKNNPILIGAPGVGKTAIVEGLAEAIVHKKVPHHLYNKRIVSIDLAQVIAGTKFRGQFEERMKAIITEAESNPDVILFIDEIHTIVGAGNSQGGMDAGNMIKPALSRGMFQCIGATTFDEFRKTIEKDGALERRFQKIVVNETTEDETLRILQNIKQRYEEHHNVNYTDDAIKACVMLSARYITDRAFPDKAIDVLDEAGAKTHTVHEDVPADLQLLENKITELNELKTQAVNNQNFELAANYRDQVIQVVSQLDTAKSKWEQELKQKVTVVDVDMVANVISMMTGVPAHRIGMEENRRLRDMKPTLEGQIIGQEKAVETVVKSIQRSRVGMKDPNRPMGVFLFLGPTGVGKTLLAKKLAEYVFDSENAIIRLDMSEYSEKHNVSRLIGSPPGYVGYEDGNHFTEKVRRKPYSIILMDEIEKAHPTVFNTLLQLFDEGRLTDGAGRTVDFRNTIIIMTSNVGTRQLKEFGGGIGFTVSGEITSEYAENVIGKALRKTFAPEFLNRIDEIVTFDPLNRESIRKIIDIEINIFCKRIEENGGYKVKISDAMKDKIAESGYDVQYGARPLKRAIQKLIEDQLAERILDGDIQAGQEIEL